MARHPAIGDDIVQAKASMPPNRCRRHRFPILLTSKVLASPLAKRPYVLRHAAVSRGSTLAWRQPASPSGAGHSVAVLLRVYAKCPDGGEQAAIAKVHQAMND